MRFRSHNIDVRNFIQCLAFGHFIDLPGMRNQHAGSRVTQSKIDLSFVVPRIERHDREPAVVCREIQHDQFVTVRQQRCNAVARFQIEVRQILRDAN